MSTNTVSISSALYSTNSTSSNDSDNDNDNETMTSSWRPLWTARGSVSQQSEANIGNQAKAKKKEQEKEKKEERERIVSECKFGSSWSKYASNEHCLAVLGIVNDVSAGN